MTNASAIGRIPPFVIVVDESMLIITILLPLPLTCFVKASVDRTKRIVIP